MLRQDRCLLFRKDRCLLLTQHRCRLLRCPVSILYIYLVSTADICPVLAVDICPVSTADICPVSTEDVYPVSTEDIQAGSSKPGEVLLSSREVEAAARGPDGQFRPELAIGGPSWPRDRAQSTAKHGWKLRAFFSGPGDHSGAVSTTFADFGPCPLSDILTPLPLLCFRFFSNSANGYAHWNRTAMLSWGVRSV